MISLNLTDLSPSLLQNKAIKQNFIYKDLKLDISTSISSSKALYSQTTLQDIQGIYDVEAVKNSIATCFLTSPGQKLLSPNYGLDIRRYLFEPITNDTAYFIRDDIVNNLTKFEPRITLLNVSVLPNIDQQEYDIIMQIDIPSLNVYGVSLKNKLNSNGYF